MQKEQNKNHLHAFHENYCSPVTTINPQKTVHHYFLARKIQIIKLFEAKKRNKTKISL